MSTQPSQPNENSTKDTPQGSPPALHLSQPLAVGRKRVVYAHPHDAGLVIKCFKPESSRSEGIRAYLRELREYFYLIDQRPDLAHLMARPMAVVATNHGLGMVYSKACDDSGNLAMKLTKVVQSGNFDDHARKALIHFLEHYRASPLLIGDMHTGNVVYAYSQSLGWHFCFVDGIGDKTFIPLSRWFGLVRRSRKRKGIRKVLRFAGLLNHPEVAHVQ